MASLPFMPIVVDRVLADTNHLTTEEAGAFYRLLIVSWRSPGCVIADDDKNLAKYTGLTLRRWLKIKPDVMSLWRLEEGYWSHKDVSEQHNYVVRKAEVSRRNGKLGGRPKGLTSQGSANPAGYPDRTQARSNYTQTKTYKKDRNVGANDYDALTTLAGLDYVDRYREERLFAECERLSGTSTMQLQRFPFRRDVITEARRRLAAGQNGSSEPQDNDGGHVVGAEADA